MLSTIRAIVRDGKIELLESVTLPEGIQLLVTVLTDEEHSFWQDVSEGALNRIWDHAEDDIYADLLTSSSSTTHSRICPVRPTVVVNAPHVSIPQPHRRERE